MRGLRTQQRRLAAVLGAAVVLAAILVGASRLSADSAETAAPAAASTTTAASPSSPEPSLFAEIEQHGAALGSPDAPATLVEYADLQCPFCADWARDALPTLVEDYVRAGKLRIVFNGMAFIGPDSDKALRTALAAGRQNHLWDVVHGLYAQQGQENAGWVTDELVSGIAAGVPALDIDALLALRFESSVATELERATAAAAAAGINSTPSFQVGPTGGALELVQISSLGPEGVVPAVEAVLAR